MPRAATSTLSTAAAALALVALAPAPLRAQDDPCDPGTTARVPVFVTPASSATGVTIDAPIQIVYSAGYFGPDGPGQPPETLLRLVRCPSGVVCSIGCTLDEGRDVEGTVQTIGDRLFFVPDGGLDPASAYVGRATGVDGVLDFRFCTGGLPDDGPPRLGAFLEARPAESTAACVVPEGGRLIGLRWEQATDDGPPGSIEYLLYLTRAPGVAAPQLRDRLRNYASPEITLNLALGPEEASEPVCVQMVAVDGVGNVSEPSPEQCFDPLTTAAFQPLCAASAPGRGPRGGALALSVALALAALVAARGRARAR